MGNVERRNYESHIENANHEKVRVGKYEIPCCLRDAVRVSELRVQGAIKIRVNSRNTLAGGQY